MSRWGGTSGNYTTSAIYTAGAGVAQTDYDIRTNTIPGGWDGNDPISSTFSVTHDFYFQDVNGDVGPVTLSGTSSSITLPDLTSQTYDPAAHERRAFGERYGISDTDDDAWPYFLTWSWEVYSPFGGNITSNCTFSNGGIVPHPSGDGNTYDSTHNWRVFATNMPGGVFQSGSYAILRRTLQIYRSGGSDVDISNDYTGAGFSGPFVRLELKSGRDGNAGDGPYFGTTVTVTGTFDTAAGGLPIAVGTGKPTTIITS